VKLSIHEAKQWDFFHVVLPNKQRVHRVESHSWDVEIRKVVWAKDVLPVFVKLTAHFNTEWKEAQYEYQLRPPAIDDTDEPECTRKGNRDHQQWKQEQENHAEHNQAVPGMDPPQEFHHVER
jgi:hypothetical protein